MHKLIPVEEATALMNRAKDWSIWHWLLEKGRVRAAADRAVDALSDAEKKVKASWSDDLKKAYRGLEAQQAHENHPRRNPRHEKSKEEAKKLDPQIEQALLKVMEADDVAENARLDAEETFAQAERQLSASMAREGAVKAIHSWELRMKAIRKAEALEKMGRSADGQVGT
jgi:hypothetical protein